MATKVVVDCSTGETRVEPLSAVEQTDYDARLADAPAVAQQQEAAEGEVAAATGDLAAQYAWAINRLDDIVTNGSNYTAAQTRSAVLDLARILRKTIRLVKADLT